MSAAAVTALFLAPAPARGAADGCGGAGPCVVVHLPDGTTHVVTAAAITAGADVGATQYATRAVAGGSTVDSPYVDHALSLRALLTGLGVDPSAVGFTEAVRPDGTWSTLGPADLADPPDFTGGLRPVVRVDGDVVEYVRPLHDDPADVNAPDLLRTDAGGALDLVVHSGPLLHVSATSDTGHPAASSPVTFTATVAEGAADVTWDFGTGETAAGTTVSHTFATPGTYEVLATAHRSDDAAGISQPVTVVVGAPAVASSPAPAVAGPSASPSAHRRALRSVAPSAANTTSPTPAPHTSATATLTEASPRPPAPVLASPEAAGQLSGVIVGEGPVVDPASVTAPDPTPAAQQGAISGGTGTSPAGALAGGATVLALLGLGAGREWRRWRRP